MGVRFPHLTKPQAKVLALWSWGMVLARSCALNAVSSAQRHPPRRSLGEALPECAQPLVRMVLSGHGQERRKAL